MVTQYFYTCSEIFDEIDFAVQCGNCKWILNKFLFALPASNFGLINYKCTHTRTHTNTFAFKVLHFTVWRVQLHSIFEAF